MMAALAEAAAAVESDLARRQTPFSAREK